ncbi:2-oxoacid:ferredoxin oxidoreductase subunit beta [Candidatus Peregrinibacteria bacterium]|nr:2-oxoacid:ferredoxin oxidoreductase subunit beta [Candidatus Peregrinibacteria bacterium]
MTKKMDKKTRDELIAKADKLLKYETGKVITWCGNCGNYGIQNAFMRALVLEGLERKDFALFFDIGCSGNGADKFEANTLHGLHGRTISTAAGAALANDKMKVIAFAGDGATFSEGVNHLVHGVRNNFPLVFVHHNNENYGLTIGQASATTRCGVKMNGTPDGVVVEPINPLQFVLSLDPTFVARGFSGDVDHLTELFRLALRHKGFAYLEILQSCPTYNRTTPEDWYASRVKYVEDLKDYDCHDIWAARKLVQDMDKEIYLGLIYENNGRKDFLSLQKSREGRETSLVEEVRRYDVRALI